MSAKKFIYTIEAAYEGRGEIKALGDDLKSLKDIDSARKLEADWAATNKTFVEAKGKLRALKSELSTSKDPALAKTLELTAEKAAKLTAQQNKQTKSLRLTERELVLAKDKYDKYEKSLSDGVADKKSQKQFERLGNTVEKLSIRFEKQKAVLSSTKDRFDAAKKNVEELTSAYKKSSDPALLKGYQAARKEVSKLSSSLKKQKTTLLESKSALKETGVDVTDLAGTYDRLKKSTEAQGNVLAAQSRLGVRSHAAVRREINGLKNAYKVLVAAEKKGLITTRDLRKATVKYKNELAKLKRGTDKWSNSLSGLKRHAASVMAVGVALIGSARAGISFESAMADVSKVVDGSPEEIGALARELQEMSRTLPLTAIELANIARAGGQLGIATKDIGAFVDVTAKMSTAFDMTAEEAGNAIGKLKNVFNLSIEGISEFGDAINQLGNTSAAREKDIVDVMLRVGGTSKQFGLATEQTAALAAAMLALGKPPQVAATSINALLNRMQTATMGSKEFQTALGKIGVSAEDMAADVAKNPQKALTDLLETLAKLDGQDRAEVLTGLFGREFQDDIGVLVGGLQTYNDTLEQVADKNRYAGAMLAEFKKRAETTGNTLILLKNAVVEIATNIGTGLLPVIKGTAQLLAFLLTPIAKLTGAFPKLSAAVVGFITTALLFRTVAVAIGLARMAFASFGETAVGALTRLPGLMRLVGGGASAMAGRMSLLKTSINGVGGLLGKLSLVGAAAFAGWEIGTFLNKFAIVRKAGLGLVEVFVLLGLYAKKAWKWISGGDTKAVAKEIENAKATFNKMYADIDSGADRQVNKSTSAQTAITKEVAKGGKDQILIAQETARQMAASYASVAPSGKKEDKKEEVDEFGYTKAERKSQAEELAKLDASRKKPRTPRKGKLYNDDGVWKYSGDPEGKKEPEPDQKKEKSSSTIKRTSATKKDDTRDAFGYTKAERKSQAEELAKLDASRKRTRKGQDLARGKRMQKQQLDEAIADNTTPVQNPAAARAIDLIDRKIAALGDLSNLGQNDQKSSERVVKLEIGQATLTTDEAGYSSFMDELQRAGLVAE